MSQLFYRWTLATLLWIVPAIALAQDAGSSPSTPPTTEEVNPLGVTMQRQHAQNFQPGRPVDVSIAIAQEIPGQITAMGLRETLPEGWSLVSVKGGSGTLPDLAPLPGTTGLLEFAWISAPALPYTFTYTVMPPEGDGDTRSLHGALEYRQMAGPHYAPPVITEIKGPDPTPPQITLKGGESLTLKVGDGWTDPGCTAIDAKKRDITGLVSVSGSVDTSQPGEYRLIYSVTDDGGRKASAERVVTVQENKPDKPVAKPPAAARIPVAPPPEPAPGGRAKSNPIAATQTGGSQKEVAATLETKPAPVLAPTLKRPDLPDTTPYRPAAESTPVAETAAPAPEKENSSVAATALPPLGPHRMPVPKVMLQGSAKNGGTADSGNGAKNGAGFQKGQSSKSGTPAEESNFFLGVIPIVAGTLAVLGVAGFLGWRLAYSRPIRRKPKN